MRSSASSAALPAPECARGKRAGGEGGEHGVVEEDRVVDRGEVDDVVGERDR